MPENTQDISQNIQHNMKKDLMKDHVLCAIKEIAGKHAIQKVVLFGSRARGDHSETSDYDVAIFGEGLTLVDEALIREKMEDIHTLKKIDIVFVDVSMKDQLLENIESEGVVIYEQAGKQADEL